MTRPLRGAPLLAALVLVAATVASAGPARKGGARRSTGTRTATAELKRWHTLPPARQAYWRKTLGLKALALRLTATSTSAARLRPSYTREVDVGPVKAQGNSGRCFIFAATSRLRSLFRARGLTPADLSESFVHYHFLRDKSAALLERLVADPATAMAYDDDLADGGTHGVVEQILATHGIVPRAAMPTRRNAASDGLLLDALRETMAAAQLAMRAAPNAARRRAIAARCRAELDAHLARWLGAPPTGGFKVRGRRFATPQAYAEALGRRSFVVLTNLTFGPSGKTKGVGYDTGYLEGTGLPGVTPYPAYNVSNAKLLAAVRRAIELGVAVPMDMSVGSDNLHMFEYDQLGDADGLPEAARGLILGRVDYDELVPYADLSARTLQGTDLALWNHEMVITATGPSWFRIRNSHGTRAGDRGDLHMHADATRRYLRAVVVPEEALDPEFLAALRRANVAPYPWEAAAE